MEFMDSYLTVQANEICNTSEGEKALLQVCNILKNNVQWLRYHLEIPPTLINKTTPIEVKFTLDLPPLDDDFNPFHHFNMLGDVQLNQEAIAEFHYDWQKLLSIDLGLSEINFRNLLSHRYELQDNAYLEESDKKPVSVLKTKFDLDPEELV
uniref:Uncharacterized protein KIAA0825-like n=1 Tax=Saccoglossus kowalevskii TaxID=10224 RepID=A0ABM0LV68_SACKO|nr:PREDICTED: uncharacterized protein KIAA0825-like [Saccoglossus kowalevskii]